MSRPDKCKWCGCAEVVTETLVMTAFRCFSSYWSDNQQWDLSEACAMKCAGQVVQLRQRIADAIAAAKQANRFDMVTEHGSTTAQPASTGCYAWASVLDDITLILTGSYPEIPDDSGEAENEQ